MWELSVKAVFSTGMTLTVSMSTRSQAAGSGGRGVAR